MKEKLKQMLGENAFNNDMKVDDDFGKLIKTVNYAEYQIGHLKKFIDDKEILEYIDSILKSMKEILEGK
jgi:hypothetical protein